MFKGVASRALGVFALFTVVCGLGYTLVVTGIAQVAFPYQANGSLIKVDDKIVGSELIGQNFEDEDHMWGRIQNVSIVEGEDGELVAYGAPSNLSPASEEYRQLIDARVKKIRAANPDADMDAVGDVNIAELVAFHQAHGKIGTMSMYNFGQNKGVVEVGANSVIDAFREKSDMDGDLINIGFMVFQPELFDLIEGDGTVFEKGPLTKLVAQKQLVGYIHQGFWQCMDTLREKQKLEQLWASGNAPWKVWEK